MDGEKGRWNVSGNASDAWWHDYDENEQYLFHRNDVFYSFLTAYLVVAILAVFGEYIFLINANSFLYSPLFPEREVVIRILEIPMRAGNLSGGAVNFSAINSGLRIDHLLAAVHGTVRAEFGRYINTRWWNNRAGGGGADTLSRCFNTNSGHFCLQIVVDCYAQIISPP